MAYIGSKQPNTMSWSLVFMQWVSIGEARHFEHKGLHQTQKSIESCGHREGLCGGTCYPPLITHCGNAKDQLRLTNEVQRGRGAEVQRAEVIVYIRQMNSNCEQRSLQWQTYFTDHPTTHGPKHSCTIIHKHQGKRTMHSPCREPWDT